MGGPRAWREMQKKQQEWQNSYDQDEENNNGGSDDEGKDVEKRDVYAEYGIDPETENERLQHEDGMRDTGEQPGQEDVITCSPSLKKGMLMLDRSSRWR